jgi:hypothetical protein
MSLARAPRDAYSTLTCQTCLVRISGYMNLTKVEDGHEAQAPVLSWRRRRHWLDRHEQERERLEDELPKRIEAAQQNLTQIQSDLERQLNPAIPAGEISLRQLQGVYAGWCAKEELAPLRAGEFGRELVDALGLECKPGVDDVVLRGATVRELATKHKALGRMVTIGASE